MHERVPVETPCEQGLKDEIKRLGQQLDEANSVLNAIRNGEVDALQLSGEQGDRTYILNGADHIYRAIVEQMQEGYVTSDADGTILFCNKNFSGMVRMPLEQVIGQSIYKLLLKASDQCILRQFLAAAEGCLKTEITLRACDGVGVAVLLSANQIGFEQDSFTCMVITDLSERKKFEAEMLHLDRLNIIGEMAAGIGHEIRNPLTTVRGYLQMFQRKKKYVDDYDKFEIMIEELDRSNLIITEFLSLAKGRAIDLKPGNLNRVIRALFPLIQSDAFRLGHHFQSSIGEIPDIYYDDKEIRQLILNLARNGLESMNSNGMLRIKTSYENGQVMLAVQDTGSGIPEKVLKNLGKPFLTTKEGGTGLGLSVCCRIAERHGAKIDIDTSSAGTTFMVKFAPLCCIDKDSAKEITLF